MEMLTYTIILLVDQEAYKSQGMTSLSLDKRRECMQVNIMTVNCCKSKEKFKDTFSLHQITHPRTKEKI